MRFSFSLVVLVLALAGCVKYSEITTPPQSVNFTSKTAQEAASGFSEMQVRTLVSTAKGSKDDKEVLAVRCTIKGTGFGASFVTPAKITMPTYVGTADPVTVTCKKDKETKQVEVKPINMTLARLNQGTVSGGGLLGVAIGAAVKGIAKAARDPLKDEFEYPISVRVVFGQVE